MIAVELFAGAGGLSLGLEKAKIKVVLANEIEPDFAKTLSINHPNTKVLCNDIHNIEFEKEVSSLGYGSVDIVSGGPPCQGFSTVGSKNKKDPRNSLFYEFLRAVAVLNPNFVLFENVSGFKRMYQGEAYKCLKNELAVLGFQISSGILEASNYGLPQKRQRTIVLGWKKHLNPVLLPEPSHGEFDTFFGSKSKLTLMDAISDLPPLISGQCSDNYLTEPQNEYQLNMRRNTKILTEHNVANYGEKMRRVLSLIPPGGSVGDLPDDLKPRSFFANTYARLFPNSPSPTITRNFGTPSSSRCVHPFQDRALSTREGARLQGFPDDYIFYGSKGSKNLQIGNAVPPIFGEIIANQVISSCK
jgi:DNA (cytosine-5)-methyltransferase 1